MRRVFTWCTLTLITLVLLVAPLPSSAADDPAADWFDVVLPVGAPAPGVVASRRTTFDATAAVHRLVAPADWKKAGVGSRVVVEPAQRTFGVRLVDCTRVEVVVEELALTAPLGGKATADHPNVELIGRVGPADAVMASVALVFHAGKGQTYYVSGGVVSGPASWDTEITRLFGDTYRLDQPSRDEAGPADRVAAASPSTCTTPRVLPNTGVVGTRTLVQIGVVLVLLGAGLVTAGRRDRVPA